MTLLSVPISMPTTDMFAVVCGVFVYWGRGIKKGEKKKEVRVESSDGGQQRKCLYKLEQRWCGWR